jgi:hypothetical protein
MATSPPSAFGLEPSVEGPDRRVVEDGGTDGIPQVGAHEVIPLVRHSHGAGRRGVAVFVDSGGVFLGKDSEIVHQLPGRCEALDVHDLGHQDRGRGLSDAWDSGDLDVGRRGQVRKGAC